MFKGHCFPKGVILQTVYFKLRFSLSYRDNEELLSIRGVPVDHAIIQRYVYKFTPLIEQTFRKRNKACCTVFPIVLVAIIPSSIGQVLISHSLSPSPSYLPQKSSH